MAQLSHFDDQGASRMVDTSAKEVTLREARASGLVHMATETAQLIQNRQLSKGDVIEVARLAGIQAAKKNLGFDSFMPSSCIDIGKTEF